ncbi:MAG TPA: hypothetical protein VGS96_17615 [Thermoanaerobaculia bacterium]|nr:hypothetical protein [Thermoanaerobaculia bacterium]
MRTTIAIFSFLSALVLSAAPPDTAGLTAEALLQRGIASYRAAHYGDAASDLTAAAQAFLAPEQMQNYVNTGKFQNLGQFETALVYLTLAQTKLGHEDLARESVLRLMTAERIESLYAQLPLDPDTAEFEAVAAKLVPGSTLPPNVQLARGGAPPVTTPPTAVAQAAPPPAPTTATAPPPAPAPAPTTTVAEVTPAPAQTSSVPAPAPPAPPQPAPVQTAQTTGEKLVVQPTLATERAERQRIIDELVAQERAKIQKAADERIAAERLAAQKTAEERIAAERTNIQKAADERIATERASIQRAADERIAAAQKAAEAQIAALQAQNRRNYLVSLRQADAYAATDRTDQANQIYTAIVSSQDAPREIVAEAAIGFYRTGAFRSAANAFKKLAPYSRGEEDLRYYNAVSLYETGNYAEAKKELACALPFIQVTDDVSRYQAKIEKTPSQQALR